MCSPQFIASIMEHGEEYLLMLLLRLWMVGRFVKSNAINFVICLILKFVLIPFGFAHTHVLCLPAFIYVCP